MFYKADKGKSKLYLMRFRFRDCNTLVWKIGVTHREPIDRMLQILRDYYQKYRYIPEADIKRFKTTDDVFSKEAALHRHFISYRYKVEKAFDGSSEMFSHIDQDYILDIYERCVQGEDIDSIVCTMWKDKCSILPIIH